MGLNLDGRGLFALLRTESVAVSKIGIGDIVDDDFGGFVVAKADKQDDGYYFYDEDDNGGGPYTGRISRLRRESLKAFSRSKKK